MYQKNNGQISLFDFISPFGRLNPENRWVKKAGLIPWRGIEDKYASLFCENNGAPAKPLRMALGALIIKQEMKLSDEETLQLILENPYMQYFIGLREFTEVPPFAVTMMVYWRKRITADLLEDINEMIYQSNRQDTPKDRNDHDAGSDAPGNAAMLHSVNPNNKGKLMLDATCVPSDIRYPTDTGLLNDARKKLEAIIDTLHPLIDLAVKPRTYRLMAQRNFLRFVKNRKPSRLLIRHTKKKQLGYVRRDLAYIEGMLELTGINALSIQQQRDWQTIQTLFSQQKQMYDSKLSSCKQRIVSIAQPFVRPIVRGKSNAPVEFGAKVSLSLADGFSFVDFIGWEPYGEASLLKDAVEAFRRRTGHYPEAVLVDQVYRNRENRAYCKERNIRMSGPRLGRPAREVPAAQTRQEYVDQAERSAIEGKFGEVKRRYGLSKIFTRLKETSESAIALAFVSMNLNHLLRRFLVWLFQLFHLPVHALFLDSAAIWAF